MDNGHDLQMKNFSWKGMSGVGGYTVDQNFEIVKSSLNIGFNLNNYTQIAFKNLGIYNNQILSKDDCIKAYNYLQTLKAK